MNAPQRDCQYALFRKYILAANAEGVTQKTVFLKGMHTRSLLQPSNATNNIFNLKKPAPECAFGIRQSALSTQQYNSCSCEI